MSGKKFQLEPALDARGVRAGAGEVEQVVDAMAAKVEQSAGQAARGIDGIGQGAAKAARDTDTAAQRMVDALKRADARRAEAGAGGGAAVEKEAQRAERATRSLNAAIERTIITQEAGGRGTAAYFEAMAKARGLNVSALEENLAKLRQVEAAQQRLQATGEMSAHATAAALRQVPAQFTDIVTGLAAGQAPLTVLLQQGGQLKDVFGGLGAAAKALGGYVVGLLTPLNLAVAAAVGLTAAFVAGASEVGELQRQLILSGSAAGVSAGQIAQMAEQIARVGRGTTRSSLAALTQLAASGDVAASGLQRYAAAAVELERVGGPAAEETAKAFTALANEPTKSALKLNEAVNFLTVSTYQQIRSLEEQGRVADAARVAQDAYASAIEQRAPQMVNTLGTLERAWLGIKQASAAALNQLLNIGRTSSAAQQVASLQAGIADIESGKLGARARDDLPALREQLAALQQGAKYEALSAAYEGERARQVRAATEWQKEIERSLTKQQQLDREIIRIRELGRASGAPASEIERSVAAARERLSPKAAASAKAGDPLAAERDAAKQWAGYYLKFSEAVDVANGKTGQLTKSQVDLVQYLQSPAYQLMAEPARQLAVQQALAAIAAEQMAEETKRAADAAKHLGDARASDAAALEKIVRSSRLAAEDAGLSDRQRRENAQIEALTQSFTDRQLRLDAEYRAGRLKGRDADYAAELTQLEDAEAKQEAAMRAAFDRQRALEADWRVGSSKALANLVDASRDIAGQIEAAMTSAFRSAEDAILQFVTTGKASVRDLANSIVADLSRIIIRQQITGPLAQSFGSGGGLGGFLASMLGSLFGGSSAGATTGDFARMDRLSGSRASGGDVQAWGRYRVNEMGPELLTVGDRQYLLMGARPGVVTPAGAGGHAGGMTLHQSFVLTQPADLRTQQQLAAAAGDGVMLALRRNR